MKYIASTRPMTRNMMTCRRPCASGCRDTPAMVALPTRPSPIAAPMAPPPSAIPKPIAAPAREIAWFMRTFLLLVWVGGCGHPLCLASVRLVELLFKALTSLAEVNDRQQHEDEGLDCADKEHVEQLPDGHRR